MAYVASDVMQITCGQCKRQILEILAVQDWGTLDANQLVVISEAAKLFHRFNTSK